MRVHERRGGPRPWLTGCAAALGLLLPALIPALSGCGGKPGPAGTAAAAAPVAIPPVRAVSAEERKQYLGSAECITCHQDYAQQLDSHHALTLAPVTPQAHAAIFREGKGREDPLNGVKYQTLVRGEDCVLRAIAGKNHADIKAKWAFGSGNRGLTFVGDYDGKPVELRISRDAASKGWEFTPGAPLGARPETPVGRILPAQEEEDCFRCHATALVKENGRLRPEDSILGVGCETCHGPGRAHVEAIRLKQADLRMPRLSQARDRLSTELCGQCHRNPETPDADHPMIRSQLPRFQGLALAQSQCFIKSEGKLSCVTCHDPHRNAHTITRAEYNAQCSSCHQQDQPQQVACNTAPKGDCVSCHMPAQVVNLPSRPKFANHWIRVWQRPGKAAKAAARAHGKR